MSSSVVASKDQVSSDLGSEVAILHLQAGAYYGLDAVGSRVWSLIQEPRTLRELHGILVSEYEVDPVRCERDLIALLRGLADEGLVEVWNGTLA